MRSPLVNRTHQPKSSLPRRPLARALVLGGVLAVALVGARPAEASLTLETSVGGSYILDGSVSSRGPLTLDIGPGLQLGQYVRVELPILFGLENNSVYPPAPHGFLGLRPQVKLFPLDPFYVKVAGNLYFPDGEFYYGLSVGGGLELRLVDALAFHGELSFNPFFSPETVLPIEARLGLTVLF
ncbi:MAG: hypothetical protein IPG45_05690 [Deltaproteobacteria bacterium]|jgi:hypothetical protein|nr:hypothetical protein [Deltaproteobacteria bacterium]